MITSVDERVDYASPSQRQPQFWTRSWFIFLVAFALRLAVVPFLLGEQLNPARDHWTFGWETGRLARSLATGHGFGSPLFGWTGPSAWMAPLYPGLLAAVFKIFGIYSKASAFVILSLNCLFSALTCVPLYAVARTTFGRRAATAAAWVWALFPYSFDFAAGQVWNTALAALLLIWAVAATIELERRHTLLHWGVWGSLWGIIGLTEPSLLACLPVAAFWLISRLRMRGLPWIFLWRTAFATLVFLLIVSPWVIRNQRVFGRTIPFRSNFWLAFYQGNTWDTSDLYPDWANPPHNPAEMAQYASLGEIEYMAAKKQQALDEVRERPLRFATRTLRHIVFTWTGYWSLSPDYLRNEPFALPNIFMTTLLTIFAVRGLLLCFRQVRRFAQLYAGLLLAFPLVYYITHPSMAYRHPLDPLLVVLAVSVFTGNRAGRLSEVPARDSTAEAVAPASTAPAPILQRTRTLPT